LLLKGVNILTFFLKLFSNKHEGDMWCQLVPQIDRFYLGKTTNV
jgi:hypothetical protein